MKLTKNAAYRAFTALREIERAETVRLAGQVRLDIAKNINRLMAEMSALEKAIGGKRREIRAGEAALAANNAIMAEIEAMGEEEIEVRLYKLSADDLKLDENARITGDMIAAIAPLLKDFDSIRDGGE